MEVGYEELRNSKARTGDQNSRPDFQHAAKARKRPDQPERNDQRKEWELPSDHRAQLFEVESGHTLQAYQRRAQSAEGYRGRVGNQRQARSRQRSKSQPDQNRPGYRDRGAEST